MLDFFTTLDFGFQFSDPAYVFAYLNLGFHHYALWFITCIVFFVYYCLINIISDYGWFNGLKKVGFSKYFDFFFWSNYSTYVLRSLFSFDFLSICIEIIYFVFIYFNIFLFNGLLLNIFNFVYNKFFFSIYPIVNFIFKFTIFRIFRVYYNISKDSLFNYYYSISSISYKRLNNILSNLFNTLYKKPILSFSYFNKYYNNHDFFISKGYLPVKNFFTFISSYAVFKNKFFRHNLNFELLVAIVPILIVYLLVVPSLAILYQSVTVEIAEAYVDVIANQWYWVYSKTFQYINDSAVYSSYMSSEFYWKVGLGAPRLLSVDNIVLIPAGLNVKFIVTSADVLHAWTLPSWSVKVDAVPGRLTEVIVNIFDEGIYFGQCSELCGVEHGFMPIQIYVTSASNFVNLLSVNLFNIYDSITNISDAFSLDANIFKISSLL